VAEEQTNTETTEAKPAPKTKAAQKAKTVAQKVEKAAPAKQEKENLVSKSIESATHAVSGTIEHAAELVKEGAEKVETSVTVVIKSANLDTVKEAVTNIENKLSDTLHNTQGAFTKTLSSVESTIDDARKTGNEKAKKLVSDMKISSIINEDAAGYVGEATSVCFTIACSPMIMMKDSAENMYHNVADKVSDVISTKEEKKEEKKEEA